MNDEIAQVQYSASCAFKCLSNIFWIYRCEAPMLWITVINLKNHSKIDIMHSDKDDGDKVTYNFCVKSDESHLLIWECLDAHDLWGQFIIRTTIQTSEETTRLSGDVIHPFQSRCRLTRRLCLDNRREIVNNSSFNVLNYDSITVTSQIRPSRKCALYA